MLAEILSSEARAEIFRILFGVNTEELHLREIERRSGMNVRSIQVELARLSKLDLVLSRRSGNRLYYRAHREHPLFPEIRGLVLKTAGLADLLRDALAGLDLRLAFVFGSVATGEQKSRSDIDLLIVGPTGFRELVPRLSPIQEVVGREINPVVLTEQELIERIRQKDHFLSRVLKSARLFVVGNEHDLGGLVQQRVAEATPDER